MFKKFLFSILYNGLTEDSGLKDKSRSAVLNSISLISVVILLSYAVIDIIAKIYLIAFITATTAILILFAIILVGITKRISIGTSTVSYIAFIFFLLILATSREERAGYFWIMLFPLVSIFFLGITHGTILTVLFGLISYFLIFIYKGPADVIFIHGMGVRVMGAYIGVSLFTIAFEIIRMMAFDQLEKTTNDLVARRKQTAMIFNNVKQGIFLLDEDLVLSEERSFYFNELFGKTRINQPFLELLKDKLPNRDFIATKDYLELFFNKTVNPALLSSINPIEKVLITFDSKKAEEKQVWLEFAFERILSKNGSIEILGLFRDITERVTLEEQLIKEENESIKNMENLFQIIHVNPELMEEFLKDTSDEINSINELLKVETQDTRSLVNNIFTIIHGIKGNAMLLGLSNLSERLKTFEDYLKDLKSSTATWRELLKLTVNLAEIKHDLDQINTLIEKIISFQKLTGENVKSKKYIFEQNLKKSIDKLCKEYNKDVILDLNDYNIDLVPDKYKKLFKDSISQFIRNSIAHGIEDKNERIIKNKKPDGTIKISLEKKDDKLYFSFYDDGRGLSLEKIKKIAIEKKGYSKAQVENFTTADAAKLIFSPGFSTSDKVDNLSGQGIGMNVIKTHVDKVGGKLNLRSSSGSFCEFKILLHA
ncbi:MAG: Hpt domain-containing protein [Spirochaetales bacterium]|nr:Hpt domain-containing protein [Spirochaetales bacterium]